MVITLFLSLRSKRVPTSTSFLPCVVFLILFRHQLFLLNSAVFFCHSQLFLMCLLYLSLPNLYFYTIRFTTVLLKVLNKINISAYTNVNYFLFLTYFRSQKSWSYYLLIIVCLKGGSILILGCWSSLIYCCFTPCMGACFHAVELDNAIRFSTLSGCQGSCGIFSNGPAGPSRLEVLACTLNTYYENVSTFMVWNSGI